MYHPRMGGEKHGSRERSALTVGSPPHGRGKVLLLYLTRTRARITPAWAGKSNVDFRQLAVERDHPRMGGEKLSYQSVPVGFPGSPPHGRGKALADKEIAA